MERRRNDEPPPADAHESLKALCSAGGFSAQSRANAAVFSGKIESHGNPAGAGTEI